MYDPATYISEVSQPGLIALRKVCIEHFKVGDYGILSKRSVRGGKALSLHAEGRAWDAAQELTIQDILKVIKRKMV